MKMYNSTKKEDGTYTKLAFIKRAWELVNPRYFYKYSREYFTQYGFFKKLGFLMDYYWCLIKFGAIIPDYFEYKFYEKKDVLRSQYLTMKDNKAIKKLFNREPRGIFRNKMLFNELFADCRNLRTFTFDRPYDEFVEFADACGRNIIAKPYTGFSGGGIHKPSVQTDEELKSVYESLKNDGQFFCEEAFVQTGILGEVNSSSVNTLRIYTIHDGKDVHITATLVRFGGGASCVDNIHGGGMCCEIDIESGIIVGLGYDLSGGKFYKHPVSGVYIPGIKIPKWDEVIALIREAASRYPEQGHIAWDVAVSDDKISIIEGNDGGNFDLPQVGMQRGMKKEYKEYIRVKKQVKNG